jgi:hypothetical protein
MMEAFERGEQIDRESKVGYMLQSKYPVVKNIGPRSAPGCD